MRYYVRARGEDEIGGPYSLNELESQLQAGTLTASHLALQDTGQTPEQARNHWQFRWIAISAIPGLGHHTPDVLKEPTHALTEEEQKAAAKQNMLLGGLWCLLGIIVTGVTYLGASSSPKGGVVVIAWGAIAFGAIQFFRGFFAR